jgi:hypothetical protein
LLLVVAIAARLLLGPLRRLGPARALHGHCLVHLRAGERSHFSPRALEVEEDPVLVSGQSSVVGGFQAFVETFVAALVELIIDSRQSP